MPEIELTLMIRPQRAFSIGRSAARVQSLSTAQEIHITGPVLDAPAVAEILQQREIKPIQKQAALRGIADKMVVYEIP